MCPNEEITEAQKPVRIKSTDFFQVSENYQQESGRNKSYRSETVSQCIGAVEQTGKAVMLFFIIIFTALQLRWSSLPSLQVYLSCVYIHILLHQTKLCFAEQSEKVLCREQKWRSSKPPVTKVKLGLALEQHELSVIPEVDTPKNCSLSLAGNVYLIY